ncbi:hypothetical protein JCM6882_000215 [Rhodosporidiobolus microsporus]
MGNNASTQAGGSAGGSAANSGRSSRHPSPRTRNVPLPSVSTSHATASGHSSHSHRSATRKKSLDMPDVVSPPSSASSSRRSTRSFSGSGMRRKGSDRVPVVDESDEPDADADAPGGSLRGALQGKAEHVVYGPRREEDEGVGLDVPTIGAPPAGRRVPQAQVLGGKVTAAPMTAGVGAAASAAATAMAIPGAGEGGSGARTPAGGFVPGGGRDGSLTNAGMGAIGASAIPGVDNDVMDPDDTTHPGFSTAPRLTSAVMMSSERMPVLNSPKREEAPEDSPFGTDSGQESGEPSREGTPGAGAGAGGRTPTQEKPSTAAAEGDLSSKVPSGDLAAVDLSPQTQMQGGGPTHPSGVRAVVTPQTSFAGAASSIFAPSPSPHFSGGSSSSIAAPAAISAPTVPTSHLLPPHTASPSPPSTAPAETVLAPAVPASALPLSAEHIPSGTSVIASPASSKGATPVAPSPAVLLPPAVFNAPVAAIPIPLLSVPSPAVAQSLVAAAVDLGAGEQGVPTLIKWKNEDGQVGADAGGGREARGPREVFVTGTFAKGWKTKIELRKTDASDFSALISLPPGPHRLKFIVDNEWKASKHLPVATDADGNLINYLQVNPVNSKIPIAAWQAPPGHSLGGAFAGTPSAVATVAAPTTTPAQAGTPSRAAGAASPGTSQFAGFQNINGLLWPFAGAAGANGLLGDDDEASGVASGGGAGGAGGADAAWWGDDDPSSRWTQDIPPELEQWGEWETERDTIEADFYARYPDGPSSSVPYPDLPPPPPSAGVPPPTLPAQLEKGPLNHAAYVTQGSGDDNSILPKPDHSVINHLAASPIKGGFLSVGVTTRYKRKFVTIVYYKALDPPAKQA